MRNGDQRRERLKGDGARVRETIQREGAAAAEEEAKKVSNC